jgi:protein-tyrosine-phosphatase
MRELAEGEVEVFSAGTEPAAVHPLAVQALKEMGIDAGTQRSKHVNEFANQAFNYVITLCESAREACPVFPGDPERIHWSFPDPGAVMGTEDERLRAFRQTAQELNLRLRPFLLIVKRGVKRSLA